MPDLNLPQQLYEVSALPKLFAMCVIAWLGTRVLAIWFNEQTCQRSKLHAKITFVGPAVIWLTALIGLMSSLGVGLTAIGNLMIASGLIIGIVITPAASNAVAGFLNAWGDVFRVGEVLEVDGVVGRVVSRRMMSTRIETIDGTMYDIPNKLLLDKVVHNFTRIEHYRIRAEVHIDDPHFSLRLTESVLRRVVEDNQRWNKKSQSANAQNTAGTTSRNGTIHSNEITHNNGTAYTSEVTHSAEVRYHAMASSSHVFHVYAWVENRMVAPRRQDELLRECALALDDAKISYGQTTNIAAPFGFPNAGYSDSEKEVRLVNWGQREDSAIHRTMLYE